MIINFENVLQSECLYKNIHIFQFLEIEITLEDSRRKPSCLIVSQGYQSHESDTACSSLPCTFSWRPFRYKKGMDFRVYCFACF